MDKLCLSVPHLMHMGAAASGYNLSALRALYKIFQFSGLKGRQDIAGGDAP